MRILYFIIVLIVLVGLSSCKVKHQVISTGVKIPASYTATNDSILVDTLSYNAEFVPPTWEVFFTDEKLKKLIKTALINNFDARTAYENIQLSKSQIALTTGIRLPDLGVGVDIGSRKYGKYTEGGINDNPGSTQSPIAYPATIPDFNFFFSTSWEIDLWGKLRNKKIANYFQFLATDEMRKLVFTEIISEISESYYNLMVLDEQIIIYTQNIELQEKALEIVKFKKEGGRVSELAVELINAQYLNVKSYLLDLQKAVIIEENRINTLLGRYPQSIDRNVLIDGNQISKMEKVGVPSYLLQNRPDIRSAEQRLRAEKASVSAAKAAFYPQLSINAKIGLNAFRLDYWINPLSFVYDIAGGLFTPLLNRRALRHELLSSKANQSLAYINYEKTVVIAFTEVVELMKVLEFTEKQIVYKKEQVDILGRSIETSQVLFTSGRAGYLEVLTAQENFLKAQNELQELLRLKNSFSVRLFKAIGGGA